MNTSGLAAIALSFGLGTLGVGAGVSASSPPIPDGFIPLVDDSLTVSVMVPEASTTGDVSTSVYEDQWRGVEVSAADPDNTGTASSASVRVRPADADVGNPASDLAGRCVSVSEESVASDLGSGTHTVGMECRGWGPPANSFAEVHHYALTATDGSGLVHISISATGSDEVALVPQIVESVALHHGVTPAEVAAQFVVALAEQDGALACALLAPGTEANFVADPPTAAGRI